MLSTIVQEQDVIIWLRNNPESALKWMYDNFYSYVCSIVFRMTNDSTLSQDITQDIFFDLWSKRDTISISSSFKPYLRRIAVNKTLNHIRKKKIDFDNEEGAIEIASPEYTSVEILEAEDLKATINNSIAKLPEKCKIIFLLSRFENFSYQEIADKLGISKKTVENQISKALKMLKSDILEKKE